MPEYKKRRTYLEKVEWFNKLVEEDGDVLAKQNAEKLLTMRENGDVGIHFPFSKMPYAIDEFDKQIGKNK